MMPAILFPGQGTQNDIRSTELAAADRDAAKLYELVADQTGLDLLSLRSDQLQSTHAAQLAIVTFSLTIWQIWRKVYPDVSVGAFAGFSLGEYTALAASGILQVPDLITLLARRAEFMQEAVNTTPGGMTALIGLDIVRIRQILAEERWADRVWIANENAPGQTVIAGYQTDLALCAETMRKAGARRIIPLDVQGAFHTPLMRPAAEKLRQTARSFVFREPGTSVYLNLTAEPANPSTDWPRTLAGQMCSPIRWTDEVCRMQRDGIRQFCELGPGQVLTGLVRRILPDAGKYSFSSLADLEQRLPSG